MLPELKGVISVSLGVEVDRFYHDWNYSNNAGVVVAVFDKDLSFAGAALPPPQLDVEAFRDETNRISGYVQKKAEGLEVLAISPKLYIILRHGILIPIEKALLERGFDKELRIAKDQLEKQLFQQSPVFAQLLGGPLENVFVDWNFAIDEGIVCFQLK
jgi:uncharacterized protein YbcI